MNRFVCQACHGRRCVLETDKGSRPPNRCPYMAGMDDNVKFEKIEEDGDGCGNCRHLPYQWNKSPCAWCRRNMDDKFEKQIQ